MHSRSFICRVGIAAVVVAVVGAGFGAVPASAAALGSFSADCTSGPASTLGTNAQAGDTFTVTPSGTCTVTDADGVLASPPTTISGSSAVTFTIANGAPTGAHLVTFLNGSAGLNLTVTVSASGGGVGGSSPAPVVVASGPMPAGLALALGTGEVCADGVDLVGRTGEWMTLPGQCESATSSSTGTALLGWATTPDFPVAIAQRQSDNRWGTYEVFDADGILSAVFIPAGWATFVSGSNTLYPIWSK